MHRIGGKLNSLKLQDMEYTFHWRVCVSFLACICAQRSTDVEVVDALKILTG